MAQPMDPGPLKNMVWAKHFRTKRYNYHIIIDVDNELHEPKKILAESLQVKPQPSAPLEVDSLSSLVQPPALHKARHSAAAHVAENSWQSKSFKKWTWRFMVLCHSYPVHVYRLTFCKSPLLDWCVCLRTSMRLSSETMLVSGLGDLTSSLRACWDLFICWAKAEKSSGLHSWAKTAFGTQKTSSEAGVFFSSF